MKFIIQLPFYVFATIALFLFSCKNESANSRSLYKNTIFFEPTMIVNYQCDNSIEGTYIQIKGLEGSNLIFDSLPVSLQKIKNLNHWVIGWGNGLKYNNTGSENLFEIKSLSNDGKRVIIGKRLVGYKNAKVGDFVCFYNRVPSGFASIINSPLLSYSPELLSLLNKSIAISKVLFDKEMNKFVMFVNEVDSDTLQTFALSSKNMRSWHFENLGKPIFRGKDFGWNLISRKQSDHYSTLMSDVINYKGVWYFVLTTIDCYKKKQISIYSASSFLGDNLKIVTSNVIENRSIDKVNGVFNAKILVCNNRLQMYYTGIGKEADEHIFGAYSLDLKQWKESFRKPVVFGHNGWRSEKRSSEIAAVRLFNDTIVLFVQGAKAHNVGIMSRWFSRNEYMARKGNVADSEIGMFFSIDGGLSFQESTHNPIMINDYSSTFENDHLGMSLDIFNRNDSTFLFYTAKSIVTGWYQPFLRVRVN